jgi:hypothetical protein
MRSLFLAVALMGSLLALGSAPAAAGDCGGGRCGTFFGLGYVPYYVYFPRGNHYQPCCRCACNPPCHPAPSCACRGNGGGWGRHGWLSWHSW